MEKCNLLWHTTILYSTDSHEYVTLVRNDLNFEQERDEADLLDITLSSLEYGKERNVSDLARSL